MRKKKGRKDKEKGTVNSSRKGVDKTHDITSAKRKEDQGKDNGGQNDLETNESKGKKR